MPEATFGRTPIKLVELDQDFCANRYGVSPCTAGAQTSGMIQGASTNNGISTAELAITASPVNDFYNGMIIRLNSGRGSIQEREISDYDGPSRVVVVVPPWQAQRLFIPGSANKFASTAHNARFHQPAGFKLRVELNARDLTPPADETWINRWGVAGSRAWAFKVMTTGRARLTLSNNGTATSATFTSSVSIPVSAVGIGVDFDADDGTLGGTALFVYTVNGVTWQTLGTKQSAGLPVTVFNPATSIVMGGLAFAASENPIGYVSRARMFALDDQVLLDMNPEDAVLGVTTWDSKGSGESWVISNGGGGASCALADVPDGGTADPTMYTIIDRANACFNTFASCQDTENFIRSSKTIRFVDAMQGVPAEWQAIPSLRTVSLTPARLNVGGQSSSSSGLGTRSSIRVDFKDHPSSDILLDPYVATRSYDPMTRGTWWTKWNARNPFHQNRPLRARFGYLGQELDEMKTYHFIIDKIEGPDSNGAVRLSATDALRLADDDKAQAPSLSRGKLLTDLTEVTNAFEVTGATIDEYETPSSSQPGTVRIGDEVMTYTNVEPLSNGNLYFSGVTRATDGSEVDEHEANDSVQRCLRYVDVPLIAVLQDLLVTWALVDPAFIDTHGWETEADIWLTSFNITTLITEPVGVAKLVSEICDQALLLIWWDERAQLVRMMAVRPPLETPVPINEEANIIANSQAFKKDPDARISQLWFYYQPINSAGKMDEANNFRRARLRVDSSAESDNEYGQSKIKKIFSRWMSNDSQVFDMAVRILNRYRDNPTLGAVELDAKDRDVWIGDIILATSRLLVDFTGAARPSQFQIISAKESVPGERIALELQSYEIFGSLVGRYMEEFAQDFMDSNTTEAQKLTGAWYCDEDGLMPDGTEGYLYG